MHIAYYVNFRWLNIFCKMSWAEINLFSASTLAEKWFAVSLTVSVANGSDCYCVINKSVFILS